MKQELPWYRSESVWGAIGTIVAGVAAGTTGAVVSPDAVATIGLSFAGAIAGAVALVGRLTAKSRLTKR